MLNYQRVYPQRLWPWRVSRPQDYGRCIVPGAKGTCGRLGNCEGLGSETKQQKNAETTED